MLDAVFDLFPHTRHSHEDSRPYFLRGEEEEGRDIGERRGSGVGKGRSR